MKKINSIELIEGNVGVKQNWTITRKCFKTESGGYLPEINVESLNGIDITIKLFKRFKAQKTAMKAIEKILVKLPLKDIGEIKF